MIFSSLTFIFFFLPAVLLIYYLAPGLRLKNWVLFLSSLVFYSWGEPVYMILMLLSSLNDYLFSNLIQNFRDRKEREAALERQNEGEIADRMRRRAIAPKFRADKFYFILSVVINLALLGVFKYTDFFIEILNTFTGSSIPALGIPLPIGISFYTFQTMSYSIDVYLGTVKAQRNFITLAAYVTLFPQLIAGPIVRYRTVEAELSNRTSGIDDVADGIRRFICGLSKKVLIANPMGMIVDGIFVDGAIPESTLVLWMAAIAYTLQIYFDFSGYSDMAIGLGRVFGFHFLENFNFPYMASGMTEFWRRWHISLGTWFRDYVYIPLGGNRKRQYLNIAVVWFLTGMWHGAYLNYILWGVYHGFFLTVEKILKQRRIAAPLPSFLKMPVHILKRLMTLFLVVVGFTIFRLEQMDSLRLVLTRMFSYHPIDIETFFLEYNKILFAVPMIPIAILLSMSWLPDLYKKAENRLAASRHSSHFFLARNLLGDPLLIALFLLSVQSIVGSGFNPFIYFRF